jgi:diguanylate cyclase (GGDEF)-like protein/PAS domain S-box-containing protein
MADHAVSDDLLEHAPCGLLATGPGGLIERANSTLVAWLGHPAANLVRRGGFPDLLCPAGRIFFETHLGPLLTRQGGVREIALNLRPAAGPLRPVLVSADARPAGGYRFAIFDAVSRRSYERELAAMRAEAEESRQLMTAVLESTTDSVIVLDRGLRVVFRNARVARILCLRGNRADSSLPELLGPAEAEPILQICRTVLATGEPEVTERFFDGLQRWVEFRLFPHGEGVSLFFRDVTDQRRAEEERRQAEARIAHLARHDMLTELPNRLLFRERLQQALELSAGGGRCALLCLDLDRFKAVNDTLGHAAGDELLRLVAQRLAGTVRTRDTVARLGGDGFAIVQVGLRGPKDAAALATRILAAIAAPFALSSGCVGIGTSIGVALMPDHGLDVEVVLQRADMALYEAKRAGANTMRFATGADITA